MKYQESLNAARRGPPFSVLAGLKAKFADSSVWFNVCGASFATKGARPVYLNFIPTSRISA